MNNYADKLRAVLEQADKLRNEADELQALLGFVNASIFKNTTGLMCDTNMQEIVYGLITYNIDGIQVANDEVSIGTSYHKVQLNLNIMPTDSSGRLITITLRESGNNSNLVIGSARINQDTLKKICEENQKS
mgnify:CR=1 FL=1